MDPYYLNLLLQTGDCTLQCHYHIEVSRAQSHYPPLLVMTLSGLSFNVPTWPLCKDMEIHLREFLKIHVWRPVSFPKTSLYQLACRAVLVPLTKMCHISHVSFSREKTNKVRFRKSIQGRMGCHIFMGSVLIRTNFNTRGKIGPFYTTSEERSFFSWDIIRKRTKFQDSPVHGVRLISRSSKLVLRNPL